jgi:competence protein ComEA
MRGHVWVRRWVLVLGLGLAWVAKAAAEPVRDTPCTEARSSQGSAEPTLVNLNTATEAELMRLPGIGPSRARAIIEFREAHRGFYSVSQLLRIKGIGRAMLKRIRPLVVVAPRGAERVAEAAPKPS